MLYQLKEINIINLCRISRYRHPIQECQKIPLDFRVNSDVIIVAYFDKGESQKDNATAEKTLTTAQM